MRPCASTLCSELGDNELKFLLDILKKNRFKGSHLEIGTAAGGTLCQMLKVASHASFMVIDPMTYFPHQLEIIKKNLISHGLDPECVDFRQEKSTLAFKALKPCDNFDFMFIDGAHDLVSVTNDLRWTRRLNRDGILCLHDYSKKYMGVWKSVNRFLQKYPQYEIIGQSDTLLALKKRHLSKDKEISCGDLLYAHVMKQLLRIKKLLKIT